MNENHTPDETLRALADMVYNIEDIDGKLCILEPRFSGCLIVRFTRRVDESVYGRVTCEGRELPRGVLTSLKMWGGVQLLGIPVHGVFTEYDREYTLYIEGFRDTEGTVMRGHNITVRTLPRSLPDPAYAGNDEVALRAAREGIVLLKNEGGALPLKPDSALSVIGGEWFRLGAAGAGRINPRCRVGLLRAVAEYSDFTLDNNAETGVIVISRKSGENIDNNAVKGEFYLSDEEEKTIAGMKRRYAKIVAVINSGYPMDLRWVERYGVDAALWCGFPGMLGGRALVEILDGRVNPSGKLPDTWSLDYFDIPASANFYLPPEGCGPLDTDAPVFIDTVYEEDIYVGYRYFETFNKDVAYPFGFGLSYTDFSVKGAFDRMRVAVTVKNTGTAPGKEVAQVYAKIPEGRLEQPAKRLVGFAKTKLLSPGEEEELSIPIAKNSLASFDAGTARWVLEKGRYEFFTGNSVRNLSFCGVLTLDEEETIRQSENLMKPPVNIKVLSKRNPGFPGGKHSGRKEGVTELAPRAKRKHYAEAGPDIDDAAGKMTVEELARLSVCAGHGWGMNGKGEAGRLFTLEQYDIPAFTVADGNNGVNINKPNIGMPCSNTLCAAWNRDLAYEVGKVIAGEAKENGVQMILAPALNIHRNPLNGRHPEYFSEDPYLAGVMAGHQSRGLEENGVSSCLKHAAANNCESARKRNHSILTERALREIYLKAFEVALEVHKSDGLMTAYNALNGEFTAGDEEMIQGVFRREFGFEGFVMTDWNSYDTADVAAAVQAGNCWMTPGGADNAYTAPIVKGIEEGRIDLARLRANVRHILRVVQKRGGRAGQ
ncbi:MAG: glycoside hydrolase family 3 C-terminal domain-containing protein [Spirochaetaceae bacterium]|jgi:beta-glucosidase|nr:glycoside hydrolase family 3 C-terminal domain-containing protein [Spirochaetaceae bacterium]